jgi:hypothetical protein
MTSDDVPQATLNHVGASPHRNTRLGMRTHLPGLPKLGHRVSRALFAGSVLLIPLCVGGCSGSPSRLNPAEMQTLAGLRSLGGARFQQSRVEVRIPRVGAAEVRISGKVASRPRQLERFFWTPIALLERPPEYLRVTLGDNSSELSTQAVKIQGGHWCVLARVPAPAAVNTDEADVTILAVFAGPSFTSALPLLVPSQKTTGNVQMEVSAPINIRIGGEPLLVQRGERSVGSVQLVELPDDGRPDLRREVATVSDQDVEAWDFRNLRYAPTGPPSPSKSTFLLVAWVFGLGGALNLLVWFLGRRPSLAMQDGVTYHEANARLRVIRAQLRLEIQLASALARSAPPSPEVEELHRSIESLLGGAASNSPWRRPDEPGLESLADLIASSTDLDQVVGRSTSRAIKKHLVRAFKLRSEVERVEAGVPARPGERSYYESRHRLYLVSALMFIAFAVLIAVRANAAVTPPSLPASRAPTAALGEFAVTVDGSTSGPVALAISFVPLGGEVDSDGKTMVSIGLGRSSHASFREIPKATPEGRASVVAKTTKLIQVRARTAILPDAFLIRALTELPLESLRDSGVYADAIARGELVRLDCTLDAAQEVSDTAFGGRINLFPFDTRTISIPLEVGSPIVMSGVKVQRPAELEGSVAIHGVTIPLVGHRNEIRTDDSQWDRRFVKAGQEALVISAQLQRPLFQRLFLTLGQLILAVAAGLVVGRVAALPESSRTSRVLELLGVVAVPMAIRTAVFAANKDLPSLTAGQAPTVFELVFYLGWALFACTVVWVWAQARSTR